MKLKDLLWVLSSDARIDLYCFDDELINFKNICRGELAGELLYNSSSDFLKTTISHIDYKNDAYNVYLECAM